MKKIKLMFSLLFLVTLAFTACEKEKITMAQHQENEESLEKRNSGNQIFEGFGITKEVISWPIQPREVGKPLRLESEPEMPTPQPEYLN